MARKRPSFVRQILVIFILYCVGQLLVYNYGVQKEFGHALGLRKRLCNHQIQLIPPHDVALFRGDSQTWAVNITDCLPQVGARNNTKTTQNDSQILPITPLNVSHILPIKTDINTEVSKTDIKKNDGNWDSSSLPPQYHFHFDVNCLDLINGNRDVVKMINAMLRNSSSDPPWPIPSDTTVRAWTANCTQFRVERRYPDTPLSKEEIEYPIAYIIVTHKDSAQVERLLRAIYQPQNVYCIHPDAKSSTQFQAAIRRLAECFENVFLASKLETIHYAGFTRLQADINCMDDLLRHPVKWKYALNLCGQDFPLKTNLEIVRQLKAFKGKNDINGIIPPPYIQNRTQIHHKVIKGRVVATSLRKTPPPYNLTIYFGNAYYAASRDFVSYIFHDNVATDLLEWSIDTYSPDEHYWVTLQRAPGTPGGHPYSTWESNVRFMKWADIHTHPPCQGKYVRDLCIFAVGYLEYLAKMPHLFGNKFYYSFDPVILQCIEELLDYRTTYPESVSHFIRNFPVTNFTWQMGL